MNDIINDDRFRGYDPDPPQAAPQTMHATLAQRRRETVEACVQEARLCKRRLLFGMTTSLMLQSVPMPRQCSLDATVLHTVTALRSNRVRRRNTTTQSHIWKHVASANNVRINQAVFALDLFHTWAALSPYLTPGSLVALGDAIITAIARQPALANGRDATAIHRDFIGCITAMPQFKGKTICRTMLPFIMTNVDSPMESESRTGLVSHGIPVPVTGHVVPDLTFRSGTPMTLDMAWPQYNVAVEYDGDQHRTDKIQWRRDQEKRSRLTSHGWIVLVVNAANLANAAALAEFAFTVARQLMLRGARFRFEPVAVPLERLPVISR